MTSAIAAAGLVAIAKPTPSLAASGGVSFWLPGIFGSSAAAPTVPGWAYASIYLHLQANAGAGQNFVANGRNGSVVAGLSAHGDAVAIGLTYTSPMEVFGGQAAISFVTAPGNVGLGIGATLNGPQGNSVSGGLTDNRTTLSDVFYQGTLKWNQGVHNEMVYFTGNIPSGTYDPNRLANLNLGFVGIDAGAGYTSIRNTILNRSRTIPGRAPDSADFEGARWVSALKSDLSSQFRRITKDI